MHWVIGGGSQKFWRQLQCLRRDKCAGERARWTRLCQSTTVQTSTRSAQVQQSLANNGSVGDWPSQTSRPRLGQSSHRPCGYLAARSREAPRKRNASKIGTVLTDKKIFVW